MVKSGGGTLRVGVSPWSRKGLDAVGQWCGVGQLRVVVKSDLHLLNVGWAGRGAADHLASDGNQVAL